MLSSNCSLTVFTVAEDKKAYLRPDRPAMIVSSTSYTEDEDFSVLLNAIKRLEDHQAEGSAGDEAPKFLFIISGSILVVNFWATLPLGKRTVCYVSICKIKIR